MYLIVGCIIVGPFDIKCRYCDLHTAGLDPVADTRVGGICVSKHLDECGMLDILRLLGSNQVIVIQRRR